ncbi:tRNA (adenosine(37)-N6)-threonylcarbamoyltransferase complex ATPase subunit type 1 TsaE [Clostridium sp. Cult2]|uniref:tRNA (adenosine(37)-N6)-threonylcarbamoyltransferase complex ATPase subunit type 1 TsaE n=1 Tax=Clostridium sp. Cult2 TaxID=2079003 RepID=UPI001F00DC79|nr:tRNA (adenosine(37)-N6)-threonylcarbamoyltransferase complex ATPase subunit type 1 TsaE [Clostridium sp. Cult2]MCF6465264.1 tRNA (adenosine(37)-N6)-threonylcarbamoyltransferase complex ATPase subunit type 1 TsaE [Clostridium sp. Cult2]
MVKIVLEGLKETEKLGEKLGSLLEGGDLISLTGDLGAGKTTLTKSIGIGLGVSDYITSPTFTLINEYKGRFWLYHFDVYRLEDEEDLLDLGYEDYFYSNGVTIVEWGDKIEDILPRNRIDINIEKGKKLDERIITISGQGERYEKIVKELNIN